MSRYFNLAEAQGLIPMLRPLLLAAVDARRRMVAAEAAMAGMRWRVTQLGGVKPDRARALELKARQESAGEEIRRSVEAITAHGVQVKDLDRGLIDFPAFYRGREVLLCYMLGESGIEYWHETDAGFGGRRRIDQEFIGHHEGEESH